MSIEMSHKYLVNTKVGVMAKLKSGKASFFCSAPRLLSLPLLSSPPPAKTKPKTKPKTIDKDDYEDDDEESIKAAASKVSKQEGHTDRL